MQKFLNDLPLFFAKIGFHTLETTKSSGWIVPLAAKRNE